MTEPSTRSSIAKAAAARDTPDKPYEVRATRPQGLLLRVQPSGARTYYVQLARGRRERIGPAGTFTLKQAEALAKERLLSPAGAKKKLAPAATLSEYLDKHYTPHALAMLKNGTQSVARVRAAWQGLLNKRMSDIAERDVEAYRTRRRLAGIAPATINRDVAALSGVLKHWVKNHDGATHPLAGMAVLKVADDERVRYLSSEESKRLRLALAARDDRARSQRASANVWRADRGIEPMPDIGPYSDHLTPMVLLSLNTGLRRGELFALAWESADLERKTITVLASHAKGNNTRTVPLSAEALQVLTTIKPKKAQGLVFVSPVTGGRFDNVQNAWEQLTKAADLPGLRWHDMRHDFASQLVMNRASLYQVQQLLGHKDAKMTQRYAKLSPGSLADVVALLGRA